MYYFYYLHCLSNFILQLSSFILESLWLFVDAWGEVQAHGTPINELEQNGCKCSQLTDTRKFLLSLFTRDSWVKMCALFTELALQTWGGMAGNAPCRLRDSHCLTWPGLLVCCLGQGLGDQSTPKCGPGPLFPLRERCSLRDCRPLHAFLLRSRWSIASWGVQSLCFTEMEHCNPFQVASALGHRSGTP